MSEFPLPLNKRVGPLAWAAFLGCSWTWCIGMFLPVLLTRRYGLSGWLVFAIPNVIGAAAMGWVLRRPDASEQIMQRHRTACVWFSIITILFHIYFTGWITAYLLGVPIALTALLLAFAFWLYGRPRNRRDLRITGVVIAISTVAYLTFWALNGPPSFAHVVPPNPFARDGVAWLIPVCVLGFSLCPYLDLTFHRARQATSTDGAKIAFGVGFGLFFLLMILFTLWYSPWLEGVLRSGVSSPPTRDWRTWLIGGHLLVQSAFTLSAHLHSIAPAEEPIKLRGWRVALIGLVWAILLAAAVAFMTQRQIAWPIGEIGYLMFLSFYGLVFPAYVWLCMLPRRGLAIGTSDPIGIWAVIVVSIIAAPMYWLGFVRGQTIWLLPAVLLVVVSPLLVRGLQRFSYRPRSEMKLE